MSLNPLSLLEKAINEHGSSTILRERIALVKEMLSKVEKERTELQTKISKLEKEIIELRKQLDEQSVSENFQKYRGVLFEKKPSGGYFETVYCASCKTPMVSMAEFFPFTCSCGKTSGFKSHDASKIIEELNKDFPNNRKI